MPHHYRKDDRVLFVGLANSFRGEKGTVAANLPFLMVRVDGDVHAMRFSDHEVVPLEDNEPNMSGAE